MVIRHKRTLATDGITFNTLEYKINGFGGCNSFEGTALFEANTLDFQTEKITDTKCERYKTENDLLKIFASKKLTYAFEGNFLQLFDSNKLVMELQKTNR